MGTQCQTWKLLLLPSVELSIILQGRVFFLIIHRLKWSILNQSQEIKAKMRSIKTEYQALRQIIPFIYNTFRSDYFKKLCQTGNSN